MIKGICYFETPGPENTDKLLKLVKERSEELDIKNIIVASVSGRTALKLSDILSDADIVCITHHAGFKEKGKLEMDPKIKDELTKRGCKGVRRIPCIKWCWQGDLQQIWWCHTS